MLFLAHINGVARVTKKGALVLATLFSSGSWLLRKILILECLSCKRTKGGSKSLSSILKFSVKLVLLLNDHAKNLVEIWQRSHQHNLRSHPRELFIKAFQEQCDAKNVALIFHFAKGIIGTIGITNALRDRNQDIKFINQGFQFGEIT